MGSADTPFARSTALAVFSCCFCVQQSLERGILVAFVCSNSAKYNSTSCDGVATMQMCTVECASGYSGASVENATCQTDGSLLATEPMCAAMSCSARKENGVDTSACDTLTYGDNCLMACILGYDLIGDAMEWTCDLSYLGVALLGTSPQCDPKRCT